MSALEIIDRIKAREKERAYLLSVLELWAQAKAQGIDPETVEAFGFDPKLLAGADKRAYYRPTFPGGPQGGPFVERRKNGSYRTLMHNYVRLKDGTIKPLNPMLKAVRQHDDND